MAGRSLVNAVLRQALRQKDDLLQAAKKEDVGIRRSHPRFLIDRWAKNFGRENVETLCEWNNEPAPLYARINRLKISIEQFRLEHPLAEPIPVMILLDWLPSQMPPCPGANVTFKIPALRWLAGYSPPLLANTSLMRVLHQVERPDIWRN